MAASAEPRYPILRSRASTWRIIAALSDPWGSTTGRTTSAPGPGPVAGRPLPAVEPRAVAVARGVPAGVPGVSRRRKAIEVRAHHPPGEPEAADRKSTR